MSELMSDHLSYSQLTAAEECPFQYYLLKMAGVEQQENGFAQAGTLAHQLLASWARGETKKENLVTEWINRFPKEVTAAFPRYLESKGYTAKLFDSILTFFEKFEGFPDYEILDAEKEFQSSIAGEHFIGIIDLILRNKETGGLMIVDYKSCSLSSFRKNKETMYRQLLLYSKYCGDTYGVFPEKLRFVLLKEGIFDERPFDPEAYIAARLWAEYVIEEMKRKDITDWFETKPDYFRCTNLCNCRNECAYGKPENHRKKSDKNGERQTPVIA